MSYHEAKFTSSALFTNDYDVRYFNLGSWGLELSTLRKEIGQVVILAGGRGERLKPITNNLPKPMAPIGDKPFLWFLCDQAYKQGIKRITILGGYLSEKIEAWLKNHSFPKDLTINLISTPSEYDPLQRLLACKEKLDPCFLLLYGDNFCSILFKKILLLHHSHNKALTLLVTPKSEGNMAIDLESSSWKYDLKRSAESPFVELGYMAIEKESFFNLIANTSKLSDALHLLGTKKQLEALTYQDSYQSISDPIRYGNTKKFLKKKKIILLDRDGTINLKAPQGKYISRVDDFTLIPEALEGINIFKDAGFSFAIISNQAGIATGDVNASELEKINQKLKETFQKIGANLLGIYICTAHWKEHHNPDRKPNPGLFHKASKDLDLRLDDTFYIGDDLRDVLAAWNANCLSAYLGEESDLLSLDREQWPKVTANNLAEAAKSILHYLSSISPEM